MTLILSDTAEGIPVGTPTWFAWLNQAQGFAFHHEGRAFTARKVRRGNHWYWYAYARAGQRLQCMYLGRSQDITAKRLSTIVDRLLKSVHRIDASAKGEPGAPVGCEIDLEHVRAQLDLIRQTVHHRRGPGRRTASELIALADWLIEQLVTQQTCTNTGAVVQRLKDQSVQEHVSPHAPPILLNPDGRGEVF